MLLIARQVSKSYGARSVLRACSLVLNRGDRVGIVGANGVGKSTLLKLLAGVEAPDEGVVTYAPSLELGYLPQSAPNLAGSAIADVLRESVGALRQLEARMRALGAEMAMTAGSALDALLEDYGQVATRFQDHGGYEVEHRMAAVLAGLGLAALPRERAVATLSGGERARVGLAALLLRAPDVLLLDEPTNHLDAASMAWLEGYVAAYAGAVAVVSHDRQFLNRGVTRILEVDDHTRTLTSYTGDYDAYAQAKRAARAQAEEAYARQQEELREVRRRLREVARAVGHNRPPRDHDKTQHHFFGERVAETVSRNVRAAEERLRRIEADPLPRPPKPLAFQPRFQGEALRAKRILRAEHLSKRHGERTLFHDLSFIVEPGARILLTGPNGAGKTTLLRLLLGIEAADEGTVRLAPGAHIGYLPQDPVVPVVDCGLLDVYREDLAGYEASLVASLLANGLFSREDTTKRISQLSLGQRRKLEIARLAATGPNILLLDEPTNYISLDILETFEAAVLAFPGPVIAVSHDRWFIQRFGGEVWHLANGALIRYAPSAFADASS
ncbi:MAG: ABC-F family ATP-binding cassette domain-containing protein [Ktedonobacterales bacterium]|nr:ABC-F family ATP-binding cassette domain-containing protein [Ktedonobacterales bacterium]